ncbi:PIN domain-containing protein [Prosthecomicrobium pneumaticum]|uniref:Ribonuclease VapC n=1 Tax=Prosthecomicrobium pneumaticum TaxID=81895 RepID=A0A7W9CTP5_9HYPH|nr:hypothetical protein [Prosthecomicrobium pneumaticum]
MFLVDTDVLSASSPIQGDPTRIARLWLVQNAPRIYLSAVTVMELDSGIAKARRLGQGRKAGELAAWTERLLALHADRILPVSLDVARLAGALIDAARAAGHSPGLADVLIAATGEAHGLRIATRNTRHFEPLGLGHRLINPFEAARDEE